MSKKIIQDYWVMHGAGNRFVLFDNQLGCFPLRQSNEISALCHEQDVDGLILIEPAQNADFFMRFYNPDGHEVDMCGNGARCVARLAYDLHIAPQTMSFLTRAGLVQAIVEEQSVMIFLPTPTQLQQKVVLDDLGLQCDIINTGVPHVVIFTDNIQDYPLDIFGPNVRHHPFFRPDGTNVNIAELQKDVLSVRTYERGVEGETLACGTGITAVALIAHLRYQLSSPVSLICAHGDTLKVFFKEERGAFSDVRLCGPATYISQPRNN